MFDSRRAHHFCLFAQKKFWAALPHPDPFHEPEDGWTHTSPTGFVFCPTTLIRPSATFSRSRERRTRPSPHRLRRLRRRGEGETLPASWRWNTSGGSEVQSANQNWEKSHPGPLPLGEGGACSLLSCKSKAVNCSIRQRILCNHTVYFGELSRWLDRDRASIYEPRCELCVLRRLHGSRRCNG